MKRRSLVLCIILLVLLILAGCAKRYKRISYGDDPCLRELLTQYINNDTTVDYCAEMSFPDTLPMYKITPRNITDTEYQETLKLLGMNESELTDKQWIMRDGNKLQIDIDDIFTSSRGYFNMIEEELEIKSREVFSKLPYDPTLGGRAAYTISSRLIRGSTATIPCP
ncbi:MAG: hypothetical protein K6G89_09605 [Clostridia bacterium]|nr:hypothetical protein [Clostridia bacterium]